MFSRHGRAQKLGRAGWPAGRAGGGFIPSAPWSPSPARGAPGGRALGEGRGGPWAAGVPGPGRPLLGLSSPQLLSSLSAFVLRVLVGSELAECAFPHTVRLVSAAERWLKKEEGTITALIL